MKGGGAFLNGSPISVSDKTELEDALLSYDLGYVDEKASTAIEMVLHLWPNIQATRIMGSAALGLAYAACGRTDMYFHHHLSPWDLASRWSWSPRRAASSPTSTPPPPPYNPRAS